MSSSSDAHLKQPAPCRLFDDWWCLVGSGIAPRSGEDREQHARRVALCAWNQMAEGYTLHESRFRRLSGGDIKDTMTGIVTDPYWLRKQRLWARNDRQKQEPDMNDKQELTLEVGKLYERADGSRDRIADYRPDELCPFVGESGRNYRENGRHWLRRNDHLDLIREVHETLPESFTIQMGEHEHIRRAVLEHLKLLGHDFMDAFRHFDVDYLVENAAFVYGGPKYSDEMGFDSNPDLRRSHQPQPFLTALEVLSIPIPEPDPRTEVVTIKGEKRCVTPEAAAELKKLRAAIDEIEAESGEVE